MDVAARILRVNGFSFEVRDTPIDVGDPSGSDQKMSWDTFTGGPVVGWTVIANGKVEQASASPPTLRFVAGFIFVEEAENLVMGFVTRNNEGALYVNGVHVMMETDSRIASGNVITDANGAPLAGGLGAIPEGTLVIAEGAYGTTSGHFRARVVEADFVAPPPPGAGDTVTITRAEERPGELRVEGDISPNSEPGTRTITLYGYPTDPGSCETPSVGGSVIQSEVPPDNGTWRVRVRSATADAYEFVCAAALKGSAQSGHTASPTGV